MVVVKSGGDSRRVVMVDVGVDFAGLGCRAFPFRPYGFFR